MGQWGLETSAGDSVHDYLQHICVDTSKFRQFDVKPLLDYTWSDIQATVRDKLGVVMHLLTHELTVPIDKLTEVMVIANNELHPNQLATWNEKAERKAMVVIEMNDIQHALENKGKGRSRHAKGLMEKMGDIIDEETKATEKANTNGTRQRVLETEAKYISDTVTQLSCMTVDHKDREAFKKKLPGIVERYIKMLDLEEKEEAG